MPLDRAGNVLNRARPIRLKSAPSRYQDWIGSTDRSDLYQFRLAKRSNVSLSLKNSRIDVDLSLLNSRGRWLQRSTRTGRQTQLNSTSLAAGVYYIKVALNRPTAKPIGTNYTLQTIIYPDQTPIPSINSSDSKPDLRGMTFTAPANVAAGSSFTVHFGVHNAGGAVDAGTRVAFYLSEDPKITTGDRLLGTYELGSLAAKSNSSLFSTALTLPGASENFFWNGDKTYSVGMIVDPLNTLGESDETNNGNVALNVDYSNIFVSHTAPPRSLKIQFDYRFDTLGWFTPERRAALEAAARVWEVSLQDEFPDVPTGNYIFARNPQPVRSMLTDAGVSNEYANLPLQLDQPIDDLLIFVGVGNLGSVVLGQGGSSLSTAENFAPRWQGSDLEPWTGSITFNTATNWFFDPTPSSTDDIPSEQNDFISVAIHEIGHILGFSPGSKPVDQQLINQYFTGANATAHNGGSPIPFQSDGSHIQFDYEFGTSGTPLMSPITRSGERLLPTVLDLAILDDLGYSVNYAAASQNLSNPT